MLAQGHALNIYDRKTQNSQLDTTSETRESLQYSLVVGMYVNVAARVARLLCAHRFLA
jgi:hypothetical protein